MTDGLTFASSKVCKLLIKSINPEIADTDLAGTVDIEFTFLSAFQNESPSLRLNRSTLSRARSPIPRFGVLIIRRSDTSSSGLTITLK